MVHAQNHSVSVLNCQKSQKPPEQRVLQTDIAVKIPPFTGIIPPLLLLHSLQRFSGKPLYRSGGCSASQKKKEYITFKFLEKYRQ